MEFDPDVLHNLQVSKYRLLPDDLCRILAAGNGYPATRRQKWGVLSSETSKARPPARRYGELAEFDADSRYRRFFHIIKGGRVEYHIFCLLDQEKWISDIFNLYRELAMDIRGLSRSGGRRNDWYLSRYAEYGEGDWPYTDYQNQHGLVLPMPQWLECADEPVNGIYPIDITTAKRPSHPRSVFASVSLYIPHFVPAILYECNEAIRQIDLVFGAGRRHNILFEPQGEVDGLPLVFIHVNVSREHCRNAESAMPISYSEVTVHMVEHFRVGDPDGTFKGKVSPEVMLGYDFTIEANHGHQHRAVIDVPHFSHEIDNKLKCMMQDIKTSGVRKNKPAGALDVDGKRRGLFPLSSIIMEQDLDIWSPNFMAEHARSPLAHPQADIAIRALLRTVQLTDDQRDFVIRCAQDGIQSNVAILEGLPGTGKTHTLATLIIALMLLGVKVVATGHANAVPTAVRSKQTGMSPVYWERWWK